MTQTASLSGLGLHGRTGLGCSLATVTHGEGELDWEKRGVGGQGFIRTVEALLDLSECAGRGVNLDQFSLIMSKVMV